MKKLISNFTIQVKHALEMAEQVTISDIVNEIRQVVICGMGGSAIAGNVAAEAIFSEVKVPIILRKDYELPNFVTKNTLVIISCYNR